MSRGKFGEPWRAMGQYFLERNGQTIAADSQFGDRTIACVNALDGIESPEAFVKAADALLDAARDMEGTDPHLNRRAQKDFNTAAQAYLAARGAK